MARQDIFWGDDISDIGTAPDVEELEDSPSDIYIDASSSDIDEGASVLGGVPSGEDPKTEAKPQAPRQPRDMGNRPNRTHRRTSLGDAFSFAWAQAGTVAERTGIDPPVGRVMQFQAPVIGPKLDALLAGSWVDRVIQPFASKGEDAKEVSAIIGFPLVVWLCERQPENVMLREVGISLLKSNISAVADYLDNRRKEEEAEDGAIAKIHKMWDVPVEVKNAKAEYQWLWNMIMENQQPATQEEYDGSPIDTGVG